MAIANNSVTDTYYNYTPMACNKCNCLQLKYLADPAILYSDIYTNALFSPIWTDHHIFFSKFILENTNESSFTEVGANTGELYKLLLKERNIVYTVLDMYKHKDLPDNIQFIQGNCETFDFSNHNTLILSHVFEHLYSPHMFIQNIRDAGVKTIFISIPNFKGLLDEKSLILIFSQHTFYCELDYIIYIFSLYNYKCELSVLYNTGFKSNMLKFVLDKTISAKPVPSTNIQLFKNIYIEKINWIKNVDIPPNGYIIPSGIYGQYFYYFLTKKENVVGFLDNNRQRHNNRLYGTDKLVYSPLSIDYKTATIIVCDCPYREEIVLGLNKICDSIRYMYI